MICGWFMRKLGIINLKLIYIESAARVNNLSISAKLIRNIVDDIFGFWKSLCDTYHLKQLYSSEYFSYNINNDNYKEKSNIINTNKSMLITVGTTKFEKLTDLSFDENFHKKLLENGFNKLIIQIGNYRINNQNNFQTDLKIEIFNFISSSLFNKLIKKTDLIISHGGAGTIIQSILNGKKPIAIANEFVNENHQLELINELDKRGYIYKCKIEEIKNFISNDISKFIIRRANDKIELNEIFLNSIGYSKINDNIPACNKKIISIIIPCIYKDIFRLEILLISIKKFVSPDLFDKIYIIIPDDEHTKFTNFISYKKEIIQLKEKINFIKETDLIPLNSLNNKYLFFLKNRDGWFKQQIFKLAIAYKIKSQFYLVLDSDCLFINNFNSSHIFIQKNNQTFSLLQEEEIYVHDKWWKGSAKLLGITKPYMESLKRGIGVTPQILSVDIVKKLCQYLESNSYNEKWYEILWSNRIVNYFPIKIWTEYTLYYLYAKRVEILNKYHIMKKNCFCDYNKSVWKLHESFEWNPSLNISNSPIIVFQSNTNLSHLIPKIIISRNNILTDFISCIMLVDKKYLDIKAQNSLIMSINCFNRQIWEKKKRELIIFCDKDNKKIISDLVDKFNDKNINIIEISSENLIFSYIIKNNNYIKGNYFALWQMNCWASPYRLSLQYNFLKDKKINNCYISPYIKGYPDKNKFFISTDANIKINNENIKNSLFMEKQCIINDHYNRKIEAINEPTIFIEINDDFLPKNNNGQKDAIKYLQNRDSLSLYYELIRLTNPFIYSSSLLKLRKKKRIYIISSELEFIPVIGGINTFLRVIISELQCSSIHMNHNTEFIFIGIKTNSTVIMPNIKDVSFKFFSTNNSIKFNSLNDYFKSFGKLSLILDDLQIFGKLAIEFIEKDSMPGDICISTIIYELNKDSLIALNKKGIKLIHTVHSLVPLKIINNLKKSNITSLYFKEKFCSFIFLKIFRFNEYSLRKYYSNFIIKKIIPKIGKFTLEMEDFIIDLAVAVIVPSIKLADITANLYYKNKHKIRCIPWGLPQNNILGESSICYNKKIYNFNINDSSQKINCLALCKIIPQKGIEILLDSLIFIEKINPIFAQKLVLNICGDMSYMNDDKFRRSIEEKIEKLDKIKVNLRGWVIGEHKKDILTNSDLFLLPSLTEPFGFCILEAMKAGLPIISFDTEGPCDIINNSFGRLVKISDYDTMTKDFGISIIDICHSEKFIELRNSSAESIKKWNIKNLIDNILSI